MLGSFFNSCIKKLELEQKALSQKTKQHYLTAFHAIFEKLVEEEIIDENPFRRLKLRFLDV